MHPKSIYFADSMMFSDSLREKTLSKNFLHLVLLCIAVSNACSHLPMTFDSEKIFEENG